MRASHVLPKQPSTPATSQPIFNTANMDVDMDLDISLDVGEEDGEAMNIEAQPHYHPYTDQGDIGDFIDEDEGAIAEDQEAAPPSSEQLAPEKIHLRGLDNLTTDHVKAYVGEYSQIDFSRLEWIDDTSANIVYNSPEIAISVLSDLVDPVNSIDDSSDLYELRRAKPLSSYPTATLNARLAYTTDVKKPRAREASRFYLMNPEYDPLERRRRRQPERGDHRRGDRRSNRRHQDEDKSIPFDESMYDEEPRSLSEKIDRPLEQETSDRRDGTRRRRRSPNSDRRGNDLFSSRVKPSNGDDRLRRRSASPSRDGDGRFGFDEDSDTQRPTGRRIRRRSLTPPRRRDPSPTKVNANKELMDIGAGRTRVLQASASKELFPAKSSPVNGSADRELFPRKTGHRNHRRKDAFDAGDETADLFSEQLVKRSPELRSRSLADRITGGPATKPPSQTQLEGINIRGAASQASGGFSIRGSALGVDNPKVKELFPDRGDGNEHSMDLFEGRISGRGGQRRKAQDLF